MLFRSAASLYSIDLTTGFATNLGAVGTATSVTGLAPQLAASPTGGRTRVITLTQDGSALERISVDNTAPSGTATLRGITVGEILVGIGIRPATGQLFGLGVNAAADTGTLYLIDPQTGVSTVVGAASSVAFVDAAGAAVDLPPASGAGGGYGFDFNPTVDRIRVVAGNGLNFRVNPITGLGVEIGRAHV